jgi:hypothetical protein
LTGPPAAILVSPKENDLLYQQDGVYKKTTRDRIDPLRQ